MKKLSLIIFVAFMAMAGTTYGQKVEVLYFKANLSCCQARSCNQLEGEIKSLIEKQFGSDEVSFKTVKLSDKESKSLVSKYKAKSQTVVIVRNDKTLDISDLVASYSKASDKKKAGQKILDKIKSLI